MYFRPEEMNIFVDDDTVTEYGGKKQKNAAA
jgi:hypothetical protein